MLTGSAGRNFQNLRYLRPLFATSAEYIKKENKKTHTHTQYEARESK